MPRVTTMLLVKLLPETVSVTDNELDPLGDIVTELPVAEEGVPPVIVQE